MRPAENEEHERPVSHFIPAALRSFLRNNVQDLEGEKGPPDDCLRDSGVQLRAYLTERYRISPRDGASNREMMVLATRAWAQGEDNPEGAPPLRPNYLQTLPPFAVEGEPTHAAWEAFVKESLEPIAAVKRQLAGKKKADKRRAEQRRQQVVIAHSGRAPTAPVITVVAPTDSAVAALVVSAAPPVGVAAWRPPPPPASPAPSSAASCSTAIDNPPVSPPPALQSHPPPSTASTVVQTKPSAAASAASAASAVVSSSEAELLPFDELCEQACRSSTLLSTAMRGWKMSRRPSEHERKRVVVSPDGIGAPGGRGGGGWLRPSCTDSSSASERSDAEDAPPPLAHDDGGAHDESPRRRKHSLSLAIEGGIGGLGGAEAGGGGGEAGIFEDLDTIVDLEIKALAEGS